jgi:hypothetical protein
MTLVRRGLAGLAVVVATALLPVRAADAASIQPGDFMESGGKGCTLGFVATSAGGTFFLTAAHCVEVGAPVELADGTVLGAVVAEGDPAEVPDTSRDWALISVRPELVGDVVASVRGTAGAPTGVAPQGETAFGDLIKHAGALQSTLKECSQALPPIKGCIQCSMTLKVSNLSLLSFVRKLQ